MLEGDLNRRLKRSASFVTGACAVIVALALMAVADGGGKLPGIGRAPILGLAGPSTHRSTPPVSHEPVETPVAYPRSRPVASQTTTPAPVVQPVPVTSSPTQLIRVDNPAPVTAPPVTAPTVGKKPRPEPVPVTSPSAPPNKTPPKRQFGGPGIAGAPGSGRGLGGRPPVTVPGGTGTGTGRPPTSGTGSGGTHPGKPPHRKPTHGHPRHRHKPEHHGFPLPHVVHKPGCESPPGSYPAAPFNRVQIAAVVLPERGRKVVRSSRSNAQHRHRGIRPSFRLRSR